jgi:hypothetical protein
MSPQEEFKTLLLLLQIVTTINNGFPSIEGVDLPNLDHTTSNITLNAFSALLVRDWDIVAVAGRLSHEGITGFTVVANPDDHDKYFTNSDVFDSKVIDSGKSHYPLILEDPHYGLSLRCVSLVSIRKPLLILFQQGPFPKPFGDHRGVYQRLPHNS